MEENRITTIEEAINLLKQKHTLIDASKTYYLERKEKVLVVGTNSTYYLTYEQFKELFEKEKFVIFIEEQDKFDFSRDEEYYNWKHK